MHRAFFKTLTSLISTNSEDIGQKFLPDTFDHTLMLYKINDLEKVQVTDEGGRDEEFPECLLQINCMVVIAFLFYLTSQLVTVWTMVTAWSEVKVVIV